MTIVFSCSDEPDFQLTQEQAVNSEPGGSMMEDQLIKYVRHIISFDFQDIQAIGEVNTPISTQETGFIYVTVPDGTPLDSLTPSVVISPDATELSPASGVTQNFTFSRLYQVKGPAPFLKRNYQVYVTFETDFLVQQKNIVANPGQNFSLLGNYGGDVSEYAASMSGPSGTATLLVTIVNPNLVSLKVPNATPGIYQLTLSRNSILKNVGTIKIL
jgi:hypothetical protein